MNFVFLTEPLETFTIYKDTSYAFMLASQKKAHNIFYLSERNIILKNGSVSFLVQRIEATDNKKNPFILKENLELEAKSIDALFIRTDPPFDNSYLISTWLLDLISKDVFIMNNPSAIRQVNEKIWATQFTDICPETLITTHKNEFLSFLEKHKKVVLKPIDGFAGLSIFVLSDGDFNASVAFETLSFEETRHVIVQKYIPEAEEGDKRILLLNGEILGAIKRMHSKNDHRNNFARGAKAVATEINPRDEWIVNTLKPHLVELGLHFVGIDIIGDYLIEVNVTSPTCIREMKDFYEEDLEARVIDFVEKSVLAKK